ncbi:MULTISPECIES: cation:proton antiporter domain-containing protein [unclassified Helicobacter]|uniref:cation:proton antiporter n=1 Tax=unclassified Helicobacter TaxID=2593540 RepID=UPI001F1DB33B
MSIVFNLILRYFDIPVIIGYIITGIVIAYFSQFYGSEILSEIAEFGIVFLMFMIGLEFSFDRLRAMKEEVLVFGILQVVFTSFIFFLISYFIFGLSASISLIIGMSFSLSSTAIVLKYFNENKQLSSTYGKSVVGILILQDIAVIPILIILALISDKNLGLWSLLLKTFVSGAIALTVLILPGRRIASKFLKLAAKSKIDEIFMATVLFIVLGSAFLSQAFGFSMSLGAFVAGMLVSKSRFKYRVESDLSHFRDIFLALFFITVGMQVDLSFLVSNIFSIALLLFFVVAIKTFAIFSILKFFRSKKSALKTALSLAQIGEFSFAIFINASGAKLFDTPLHYGILKALQDRGVINLSSQDIHQFLVLMVILSMITTPFILKGLGGIIELLLRKKENAYKGKKEVEVNIPLLDYVVVIGYGTFGSVVVKELKQKKVNYIAIDCDITKVEMGEKNKDRVIFGDISKKSFLKKFHFDEVKCIIIAIDNTSIVHTICEEILEIAPNIDIIARVDSELQEIELKDLNVVGVNTRSEIARLLVKYAIRE